MSHTEGVQGTLRDLAKYIDAETWKNEHKGHGGVGRGALAKQIGAPFKNGGS